MSLQSALTGDGQMAVGNVVGSNIFNILIIVGLAALITPREGYPPATACVGWD